MTSNGNGQHPEMMTAGQVARTFDVDRKTVNRWEKKGLLTSIRYISKP